MGQNRKMFIASLFANSERTHPADKQMNHLPSSVPGDQQGTQPWLFMADF